MFKYLMVALLCLPLTATAGEKHECHFAPENDMYIAPNSFAANGMTKEVFDAILDRIEKHYRPIVESNGARFQLQRAWDDGTVNAYAQQQGSLWLIKMFGGLARHQHVTPDGFAMVACHEMGHHLAGAPRARAWASNEGQSDYFATAKCARRIWAEDDNVAIMEERIANGLEISETAKNKCNALKETPEERALCLRGAMAGLSLGTTLASLGGQGTPSIDTPDNSKVSRTNHRHPKGQCRTDTYYQGALCEVAFDIDFDASDEEKGACTRKKGHTDGLRSLCWYKPAGGSGPGPGPGPGPKPTPGNCPFGDQSICDTLCRLNPNYEFCNKVVDTQPNAWVRALDGSLIFF